MTRKFFNKMAALLVLLPACAFATNFTPIQSWITHHTKQYHITGLSVTIIKNHTIAWSQTFGYRNKSKGLRVRQDTLFNAASISKPVTALATLLAFQQKSFSLNKSINSYLTSWRITKNTFTEHDPITMKQLLSHTAGITGFRCKGYTKKMHIPSLLQALNGASPANTPKVTVIRKPNSFYDYSPASYMIVQQTLIDTYHQSFPKIMQQLVLQSLKMNHSAFGIYFADYNLNKIALPYLPNGHTIPGGPLRFVAQAAGGLWTTANDLAKFIIFIQRAYDGRLGKKLKVLVMHYLTPSNLNPNMGSGINVNLSRYGTETKHGDYFGHSGWNSGYLSFMIGSKMNGNGIVILMNTAPYMTQKGPVYQYDFIKQLVAFTAKHLRWKR